MELIKNGKFVLHIEKFGKMKFLILEEVLWVYWIQELKTRLQLFQIGLTIIYGDIKGGHTRFECCWQRNYNVEREVVSSRKEEHITYGRVNKVGDRVHKIEKNIWCLFFLNFYWLVQLTNYKLDVSSFSLLTPFNTIYVIVYKDNLTSLR